MPWNNCNSAVSLGQPKPLCWTASPLMNKSLWETLLICTNMWWDSAEKMKQCPSSVVPSDRKRGSGHKLKHRKYHLNTIKLFLLWFTVAVHECWHRFQRSCGVSIPGDPLNLSGHCPGKCGKPALAAHALSKVGQDGWPPEMHSNLSNFVALW